MRKRIRSEFRGHFPPAKRLAGDVRMQKRMILEYRGMVVLHRKVNVKSCNVQTREEGVGDFELFSPELSICFVDFIEKLKDKPYLTLEGRILKIG